MAQEYQRTRVRSRPAITTRSVPWTWLGLALFAIVVGIAGGWTILQRESRPAPVVQSRPAAPTTSSQAAAPSSASPSAGQNAVAPDLAADLLDGATFRLSEHRGKAVMVMFTASWCGSCIPEIAKLAQLDAAYRSRGLDILVLSVDPNDTTADFQRFKEIAKGADHYWGLDSGQRATLAYRVQALETLVLIGPDGRIVSRTVGPSRLDNWKTELETLLQ